MILELVIKIYLKTNEKLIDSIKCPTVVTGQTEPNDLSKIDTQQSIETNTKAVVPKIRITNRIEAKLVIEKINEQQDQLTTNLNNSNNSVNCVNKFIDYYRSRRRRLNDKTDSLFPYSFPKNENNF